MCSSKATPIPSAEDCLRRENRQLREELERLRALASAAGITPEGAAPPREQGFLDNLMKFSPDYIYFKDRQSRFIRINHALAQRFGYEDPGELLGKTDFDVHPHDRACKRFEDEQRIMESGQPIVAYEEQEITQNGTVHWVSSTKVPLRDANGEVIGIVGISRDITGHKEAENELRRHRDNLEELVHERTVQLLAKNGELTDEIAERQLTEAALRQSQQRQRLLFETMLQGVVHHDADGKVTLLNPAAERILGKTLEEMEGWPFSEMDHRALREDGTPLPAEERPALVALRTGRKVQDVVMATFNPKVNDYRWINVSAVPMLREGEERASEVYVVFDDITERKNAEALRLQQEVQARHTQKMQSMGQLAAGIAHEINTPIQFVGDNVRFLQDAFSDLQGAVRQYDAFIQSVRTREWTEEKLTAMDEALKDADLEYLAEEIPNAIQQSKDGVERVSKIVRAMKEFSHPGATEKSAIDLNRAIESTLTVCRSEWKYVAKLVTNFDADLPSVICLPGEINQVVLNLVVNAAHAIADTLTDGTVGQGTITVGTKRDGDWVELRISDTGTGIPESARSKIFSPFFTTKGVGKGTGQGLSLAHSVIVEKHGGTITFETEMGHGTTFIIRLPLTPSSSYIKS